MSFDTLPKINSDAKTCVRWNPKLKRYELVVGGVVLASISRLRMSIRAEAAKFRAQVVATYEVVTRKQRANAAGAETSCRS
jgi:hypothetical protein